MDAAQSPQRVTSADFIRRFASWRMHATRTPVVVTHHGKDAHVLISHDDYRRMEGADDGPNSETLMRASHALLLESVRDGLILIDRDEKLVAVNPAASDLLEMPAADLVGFPVMTKLPMIATSLIFHHVTRMLAHRERFSGDMPSLLRPGQWLHIDLIPLPIGGAIILRDVTDAITALETSDARRAALRALDANGGIGHACISLREAIEYANDALTCAIGVGADAIRRVKFSALLAVARRTEFAQALEGVLREGVPARIESDLVARDGALLPVTLSIAERRNAYFSDGAVILVTHRRTG